VEVRAELKSSLTGGATPLNEGRHERIEGRNERNEINK
jgi:hypothetical protein